MSAQAPKWFYLVRHCAAMGQAWDASLTLEGETQAVFLADALAPLGITRIITSPYIRAVQSIMPLAARLTLTTEIQTDNRLTERILSSDPLPDWHEHLRISFDDPDYALPGGESSRTATARAVAALTDAQQHPACATVIVTHGNLLVLLLRHFDAQYDFAAWECMTNPDIYRLNIAEPTEPIIRLWS